MLDSFVRRVACVLWIVGLTSLVACGGGRGGGGGGGELPPPPGPPASPTSDDALVALDLSTGTLFPAFSPDALEYVVGAALLPGSITLVPTTEDPLATVTVDGMPVASGAESLPVD